MCYGRFFVFARNIMMTTAVVSLVGCSVIPHKKSKISTKSPIAHINTTTKFSSSTYGVKGSPRVTTSKKVRKGGGRYQIGKPYKIKGKWYRPKDQPGYNKVGMASWYGPNFHGRLTANGEVYDQYSLSAAHPTLPLPSYARVTNLENGSTVTVRINDRGPFSNKRIIDLSAQASKLLGYQKKGLTKVRVKYLGKARMDGLDAKYLMASYKPGRGQRVNPSIPTYAPGATRPGTLLASINPLRRAKPSTKHNAKTTVSAPLVPQVSVATSTAYTQTERQTVSPPFQYTAIPVPQLRPTPFYSGILMELVVNEYVQKPFLEPISFVSHKKYNSRIAQAFSIIENRFPITNSHSPDLMQD